MRDRRQRAIERLAKLSEANRIADHIQPPAASPSFPRALPTPLTRRANQATTLRHATLQYTDRQASILGLNLIVTRKNWVMACDDDEVEL
jgi:hypothetical protein